MDKINFGYLGQNAGGSAVWEADWEKIEAGQQLNVLNYKAQRSRGSLLSGYASESQILRASTRSSHWSH